MRVYSRRLSIVRAVVVLLAVGGLAALAGKLVAEPAGFNRSASTSSKLSSDVERVLWWLPEETSSLAFSSGNFSADVCAIGDEGARAVERLTIPEAAAYCGVGPVLNMSGTLAGFDFEHRLARDLLAGGKVKMVVVAMWYAAPKEEGELDGCGVVCFNRDGAIEVVERLRRYAIEIHKLSVCPVLETGETTATGRLFVAAPENNVLIYSATLACMKNMLDRMTHKPRNRALPAQLPQWSNIEAASPVWAMRLYDPKVTGQDRTTMTKWDANAKGITVSYSMAPSPTIVVRYLSGSVDAPQRFNKMLQTWDAYHGFGRKRTMPFQLVSPGVFESRLVIHEKADQIPSDSYDDSLGRCERFVSWFLWPLAGVNDRPHTLGD